MKTLSFAIFSALLSFALFANAAESTLTPEETEYIEAFTPIAEIAQEQGFAIKVAVISHKSKNLTKVFSTFKDNQCIFGINIRSNTSNFDPMDIKDNISRRVMLQAILAHEMGHCYQDTLESKDEQLLKINNANGQHERELRADLFAIAWTAVYHPEDFAETIAYLKKIRGLNEMREFSIYPTPDELTRAWGFKSTSGSTDPEILKTIATRPLDAIFASTTVSLVK